MKATETTILKFIGGLYKTFIIPPFQRNYEWTTEQCDELFEDILNAVKSQKPHYLGNIIYYQGENSGAAFSENILIDGQQRVTTILLLLCAIRDITTNEVLKKKIDKHYLQNEDTDDSYRIRLKQTDYDAGCFERLVNGTAKLDEKGKLATNYNRFKELIKDCGLNPEDLFETIPKLEVVEVNLQIDELETVQTIFEKINSTGKPLSAADLIRNYLLITNNSKEQNRLYRTYWLKIEKTITTEYISDFVKDYLIMKIYEDVEKDNVYKEFKGYVKNTNLSHEDILKDMNEYAPFYKQILTGDISDKKLAREIQILTYLKAKDMNCLFMYLLKRCNDENLQSVEIFNLIRCFLTRYRIVSPSAGGGALRHVIHSLVKKLQENQITCDFDSIQFELSNSPTRAGRYPDDEDFKTALMLSNKQNHNYGRAILLAIEEFETKNVPTSFSEVTIEHLMPQTLSEWWTNNLGGKEKAEITYNNYINSIGNLAPLSGPYNSENSNKSWLEKVKIMKDVQFKTTKEVLEKTEWTEAAIQERNKDIAERACKAILAPLPRTRAYTTQKTFDIFIPGTYPISDLDTNMNGSDIKRVSIAGTEIPLESWNQLLVKACEYVLKIDMQKFVQIVKDNLLHKSKKTENSLKYAPIISDNKDYLNSPKKILSTPYFAEGNISCSRARYYTNLLLQQFNLSENSTITVYKKDE